jgi:hypothetical protein
VLQLGKHPCCRGQPGFQRFTERVPGPICARESPGELDSVQHLKGLERGDADEALNAQRGGRLLGLSSPASARLRTASQLTTRNPAAPSASSTDSMRTPQSVDRMGAAAGAAPEVAP